MSHWPSGKVTVPVPSYQYSTGTITITSTGTSSWGSLTSAVLVNSGNSNNWATISNGMTQPSLQVTGKANFDDDVTIKGISLLETLEKINERLAILVPDPEKLEEFTALKKAYENYKLLEALCYKDKK
jgi:hypothetical protein